MLPPGFHRVAPAQPRRQAVHSSGPRGFTLIELLVVVSIIAILAAMLLPALQGARLQAQKVVCINQHHQTYLGAVLYTEDFNGRFPTTDGSWLDRHKKGADNPQGLGLLATEGYMPLDIRGMEMFFCPSAKPAWNWREPNHVLRQLTTQLSSGADAYSTVSAKFCTYVGYNSATNPTQADLFLGKGDNKHRAERISPVIIADYIFDSSIATGNKEQGHGGKGVPVMLVDGSSQFVYFHEVYWTGKVGFGGTYNNRNPYGNFWYYCQERFRID